MKSGHFQKNDNQRRCRDNLRNGLTQQKASSSSATLNYTAAKKGRSKNKLNKCKSHNKRMEGTTVSANL